MPLLIFSSTLPFLASSLSIFIWHLPLLLAFSLNSRWLSTNRNQIYLMLRQLFAGRHLECLPHSLFVPINLNYTCVTLCVIVVHVIIIIVLFFLLHHLLLFQVLLLCSSSSVCHSIDNYQCLILLKEFILKLTKI